MQHTRVFSGNNNIWLRQKTSLHASCSIAQSKGVMLTQQAHQPHRRQNIDVQDIGPLIWVSCMPPHISRLQSERLSSCQQACQVKACQTAPDTARCSMLASKWALSKIFLFRIADACDACVQEMHIRARNDESRLQEAATHSDHHGELCNMTNKFILLEGRCNVRACIVDLHTDTQ